MTDESLLQQLDDLESRSESLATSSGERASRLAAVRDYAEEFISGLADRKVYSGDDDRESAMAAMRLSAPAASFDAILDVIREHVDNSGHNLGSPGFYGYVPSGGLYESALADYLAAVSNRYVGVSYGSPGAARMEETVVRWLADAVGYPETAEGDLTSGGSIAALSAIVVAREAHGLGSAGVGNSVVYCTSQIHHTFRKALFVAGVGDCVVRDVAMDEGLRMDTVDLAAKIAADREAGLSPWLIAASAGSTDVGAIDPLDAIADIAADTGCWFHVDAAYGGAFMLCEEGRRRLHGIARSDSLILDPHKGFFLPAGVGAVLVRDGAEISKAYRARGTYMQDMDEHLERSACDVSPELTRPFRALRFWLPLKLHGMEPFAAALQEKLLLADYCKRQLQEIDGLELGPGPDLSVVSFRLQGGREPNLRLLDAIIEDGRIFINSTTIHEKYTLRFAILGYSTHRRHIDTAIDVLREMMARTK